MLSDGLGSRAGAKNQDRKPRALPIIPKPNRAKISHTGLIFC
ncbi:hypothetical protein SFK227_4057 [Shigella flexneri K-227]|uniref:Uncharacterized protein n=1 Tax=Shigella flexneri K-227 TaxID=766147 RepID=F5P0T4_SHIFL|nr:hypothetical protein SF293071_4010 [Shigella flexneri 2930-71]EGK33811.1 hypothetical protein SFK227_4057 [Shigella flexneri K-227]EGM58935.1 hypothetical protein SFJ1713_4694 [Shigella flexneri SFJ17B]